MHKAMHPTKHKLYLFFCGVFNKSDKMTTETQVRHSEDYNDFLLVYGLFLSRHRAMLLGDACDDPV